MTDFWGDLPAWVRAGPLVVAVIGPFFGAAVLSWVGGRALVVALPPVDAPWAERARALWPLRANVRVAGLITSVLTFFFFWLGPGLVQTPRPLLVVLGLGSVWAGTLLGSMRIDQQIWGRRRSVRERLVDPLVMQLSCRGHVLVLAALAMGMHPTFDRWTAVMLGSGLAVLVLAMRGDHFELLRLVGIVREGDAAIAAAGARAAASAGVAAVPVDVLRTGVTNAAAFPIGRRLFATEGLVNALDEDELAAILAHEYAHLSEGAALNAARVFVGLLLTVPLLLVRPLTATAFPAVVWGALIGGVLGTIAIARVARRMEERADRAAARADGGVFARALERIYALNLIPAVMPGRGRTHPHLYDRMLAAGVTPEWPRPAAPSRAAQIVGTFGVVVVALSGLCGGLFLSGLSTAEPGEGTAHLRLALGAGRPWDLTEVAQARFAAGEPAVAGRLYAAAAELSPTSAWEPANLSLVLAGLGECEGAARAAREARARVEAATEAGGDPDGQPGDELFGAVDSGVAGCFAARSGGLPQPDAAPDPHAPPP